MSEAIMNLLQSFMGCMYPGSIRTESIESMNDYSEYKYVVENIDEQGEVVSKGELHITDKNLLYYRPGRFPTRWPVEHIRRFGSSDRIFSFEAGRRCQTGPAIYAFHCDDAADLVNRLMEITNQFNCQRAGFETKKLCDKKDAATITDNTIANAMGCELDPRPLSYALIDFDSTKALNKTFQAHVASRTATKE